MVPNCYFCQNSLSQIDDGAYRNHYSCYKCPKTKAPFIGLKYWEQPCNIIMYDGIPEIIYLYFHNTKLWLHTFYFTDAYTDIKTEDHDLIVRLQTTLNVLDIPPHILENKMKNWILFS